MGKSWVVLSLFGKGTEMGLVLLASALPVAFFSIYAGVYADRNNPRVVLLLTQVVLFFCALLLGVLAYFGVLEFWHLIVLGVFEGLAIAFDAPAFQVLLPRLVGRENLQQTLALNSSSFHLSRILGPALAGILLAAMGVSAIFILNAVSFLLVCYTVYTFKHIKAYDHVSITKSAFKEFTSFLSSNPFFVRILLQFLLVMTFIFPHTFTTLRLLVTERFHLDAQGFGIALTGPGLGAFLGSTLMVVLKPEKPYSLFPWGLSGIVVFASLMLFCNSFWWMNVLLVFYTFSLFLYLSSLLVSLQLMTENHLRGRLSAVTTLAFGAWAPLWSALWGWSSDKSSPHDVFGSTGLIFLTLSIVLLFFGNKISASKKLVDCPK